MEKGSEKLWESRSGSGKGKSARRLSPEAIRLERRGSQGLQEPFASQRCSGSTLSAAGGLRTMGGRECCVVTPSRWARVLSPGHGCNEAMVTESCR